MQAEYTADWHCWANSPWCRRQRYGQLPVNWRDRVQIYKLYHALELWDWFASLGNKAAVLGFTEDLQRFSTVVRSCLTESRVDLLIYVIWRPCDDLAELHEPFPFTRHGNHGTNPLVLSMYSR